MAETMYGYVRVSTKEQCEDCRMLALKEFGMPEENIFMDKLSGKDFNRPKYKRLRAAGKRNDCQQTCPLQKKCNFKNFLLIKHINALKKTNKYRNSCMYDRKKSDFLINSELTKQIV